MPAKAKARRGAKTRRPARAALPEDLVSLAGRVVDRAVALGADDAEAFAMREVGWSVDVEAGRVAFANRVEDAGVGVRLVKGGAAGFGYLSDERDLSSTLETALASLRVLPRRGFELPGRGPAPAVRGIHDRRLAAWGAEDGVREARSMMEAARAAAPGVTIAGGGVVWSQTEVALRSSAGVRAGWRGTQSGASLHAVLREAGSVSTGFEYGTSRRADVDVRAVGREAARLAKASRRPKKAPSGALPVLFRPTALEGLFEALVVGSLSGDAARAGRSVWAGRLGEDVAARGISIVEDGRLPGGPNSAPVDDEGVGSRRVPLVERGRLRAYLDDAAGARAAGGKPTSSAIRADRMDSERSWRSAPRATGRNLVVGGSGTPVEDLLADVRSGLVVHDALGAHTANPGSGEFSVNATVVFRVEKGEIVGAARPVMLAGNLPAALMGARLADDRRALSGSFSPVAVVTPGVLLPGVAVSG